jgi:hypothetical protein
LNFSSFQGKAERNVELLEELIEFNIGYIFDQKDLSKLVPNQDTIDHAGFVNEAWLLKYGYYQAEESNFMINCFKQINWPDPFPEEKVPSVKCKCMIP